MFRKRKGQTILEYVLLITVVLLVAIYGVNTVIKARTEANMVTSGKLLDKAASTLSTATSNK